MRHRFRKGESVTFQPVKLTQQAANGTYKVMQLLPLENGVLRYRIKSAIEVFERIVPEAELLKRA